jgi:hypothetical protein
VVDALAGTGLAVRELNPDDGGSGYAAVTVEGRCHGDAVALGRVLGAGRAAAPAVPITVRARAARVVDHRPRRAQSVTSVSTLTAP